MFVFSRFHASRLTPHASRQPHQPSRSRQATAVKLEDSVRQHLVSDVPVGAFLSGGIDSSAIVALMSRVADQKPKTFSVVFKESEFSEAAHAQLVAKTFGTEHREIMLSEDHLLGMLPDALEAMDQPTMDGINTYVVSKAVKESGVTVALSGLGGDELFAGYPSFRRAKAASSTCHGAISLFADWLARGPCDTQRICTAAKILGIVRKRLQPLCGVLSIPPAFCTG